LFKALGADKVVDYTIEDFANTDDAYDIIFDTVGKSSYSHCRKALTSNGKYVCNGNDVDPSSSINPDKIWK